MKHIKLNLVIFILSLLGCFVAWMLSLFDWKIINLPCSTDGCSVLSSWAPSKFISTAGLLFYALTAYICLQRSKLPVSKWNPLNGWLMLISTVGIVISWFLIIYGKQVLFQSCDWCLASAFIATLIFIFQAFLISIKNVDEDFLPQNKLTKTMIALTLVLAVVGVGYAGLRRSELQKIVEMDKALRNVLLPSDIWMPASGQENAPIIIVEFSDFTCPSCAQTHKMLQELIKQNPKSIRVIYRQYPLIKTHPHALDAAVAQEIVASLDKDAVMRFRNLLWEKNTSIDTDVIYSIIKIIGLNEKKFKDLFDKNTPDDIINRVHRDLSDGSKAGVNQTPTFFVLPPDGSVKKATGYDGLLKALVRPSTQKFLDTKIEIKMTEPEPSGHHH